MTDLKGLPDSGRPLEERMTPEESDLYSIFKAALGKPVPEGVQHELFFPLLNDGEINQSLVRKWTIVNGDSNPLWTDEEYAIKTTWGGTVVPPLFLLTLQDSTAPCAFFTRRLLNANPYPTPNRKQYPNYRGVMQANTEWEFFEVLRPRDQITAVSIPTDIQWKMGKRYRLLFIAGVTDYKNQKGRLVARNHIGAVYMFK